MDNYGCGCGCECGSGYMLGFQNAVVSTISMVAIQWMGVLRSPKAVNLRAPLTVSAVTSTRMLSEVLSAMMV